MPAKTFGYARVSARDQNEARQVQALLDAGIPDRDLFIDRESGAHFDRQAYQALLTRLRPGDTLVVLSLDRLGRHYTAIQEEWRRVTQELEVHIRVLDMPLLDSHDQSLDARFLSDLVLQILSYVAQKERENIRARQRQGIDAARQQGKHLGRPRLRMPPGFPEIYARWRAGEMTAAAAMARLSMKRTSFYKMVKRYEADKQGR